MISELRCKSVLQQMRMVDAAPPSPPHPITSSLTNTCFLGALLRDSAPLLIPFNCYKIVQSTKQNDYF